MTPEQKQAAWESVEAAVAALRKQDPELALSIYRAMVLDLVAIR